MSLVGLLLLLVVIALLFYVLQMLPLEQPARTIIYILAVVVIVLWLLQVAGFDYHLGSRRFP